MLKLGRSRPTRPETILGPETSAGAPGLEPAAARRLARLVATSEGFILFERSWRVVLPPVLLAGFFVAASWAGLWLLLPHWARALGVFAFGIAAAALVLGPLRFFRLPTRKEALARLDRLSGLASRPAETLADRLANAAGDSATQALWALHRRRAEAAVAKLHAGLPSPRMAERDPFALRALVPVLLVATSVVAGPEKFPRLAAAFDWRLDGFSRYGDRIDAWIDPPAYTGKVPQVLNLGAAGAFASPARHERVEAPAGSIVIVRGSGGRPTVEARGGLGPAPSDAPGTGERPGAASKRDNEVRLILDGDATLAIGAEGARLGVFDIKSIADEPPTIAYTDVPQVNARGSMTLAYKITDDYGAISAEATLAEPAFATGKKSKRSLVDAPRVALAVPPATGTAGGAETIADLSEHPWAGARAVLMLAARDAAGNEGRSAAMEILLPQKPFANPLARALAEQRRNLVLAPDEKAKVETAIDALAVAPDAFGTSAGVYLGLTVASLRLKAARKDADLLDVADHLWDMALRIESGDLSAAERELRAAEQALREALARNAPDDEIRRLAETLRAALDSFLREFAKQDQGGETEPLASGQQRAIDPGMLHAMLDRLQDMVRSGERADAQRMLDQLQNILENMKTAQRGQADPRAREMKRALDELTRLGKDEQELRDDSYRRGQEARRRQDPRFPPMGGPLPPFFPGQSGLDDELPRADEREGSRDREADEADLPSTRDLAERQRNLRERLSQIKKRLQPNGQKETNADLDSADEAMGEAAEALDRGAGHSDDAVEAQGRVLSALRRGAQKLAEAMQNGGADGPGEATADGDGNAGGRPQFGRRGGTDPLGRLTGNGRSNYSGARYDPLGAPAALRAQRVLEELRRRLGEPARPREELDYLERLLRRY